MQGLNIIRKQLKEYRLNKNMTQSKVADTIGVKDSTISNYEMGNSKTSLETIMKLCDIYEVKPIALFNTAFWREYGSANIN